MIEDIHHLGLTVRDVEVSAAWYADVLGFRRVGEFVAPDGARRKVFLRHDGLRARLGLTQHRDGPREAFDETRAGLDHLAFATSSREELDDWARRLADAGVVFSPVASANSIPGAAVLVFRDPDNIQLELFFDPTDIRYGIRPIGWVESPLVDPAAAPAQGDEGAPEAWVVLRTEVRPAMRDLAVGSTVIVMTWLDRADRDVARRPPSRRYEPAGAGRVQHAFTRPTESDRAARGADRRDRRNPDPGPRSRGVRRHPDRGHQARARTRSTSAEPRNDRTPSGPLPLP